MEGNNPHWKERSIDLPLATGSASQNMELELEEQIQRYLRGEKEPLPKSPFEESVKFLHEFTVWYHECDRMVKSLPVLMVSLCNNLAREILDSVTEKNIVSFLQQISVALKSLDRELRRTHRRLPPFDEAREGLGEHQRIRFNMFYQLQSKYTHLSRELWYYSDVYAERLARFSTEGPCDSSPGEECDNDDKIGSLIKESKEKSFSVVSPRSHRHRPFLRQMAKPHPMYIGYSQASEWKQIEQDFLSDRDLADIDIYDEDFHWCFERTFFNSVLYNVTRTQHIVAVEQPVTKKKLISTKKSGICIPSLSEKTRKMRSNSNNASDSRPCSPVVSPSVSPRARTDSKLPSPRSRPDSRLPSPRSRSDSKTTELLKDAAKKALQSSTSAFIGKRRAAPTQSTKSLDESIVS